MALARWGENAADSREIGSGAGLSVTDVGAGAIVSEPPVDLERGTVLAGRYQVETFVGKGGSGVVLRAFDRITQSAVALKILNSELAADPHWVERFARELRLGRQIQHPNVCRVFDIGESDGHRFLSMELASGGTLRDAVRAGSEARPLAERVADVRALVSGLAALHAAGILHRDVKPENLLRMDDGRVVLSDFGLATNPAQAPMVTVMVGTPSYMAPEIVMGDPASQRSDVWALGVTMHEILFGKRPVWDIVNGERVFRSPLSASASRLERTLADLCGACAAERPPLRPADAGEVLARMTLERPSSTPRRARWLTGTGRRIGWAGVSAALAGLLVIAGARGNLWSGAWATLETPGRPRIVEPMGTAQDWSRSSRPVAEFAGRVHCLGPSPDGRSVQVIWGTPAIAEDVDPLTGRRVPSRLQAATFQHGCPQLSRDGERLLFSTVDASGAMQVMLSDQPDGAYARPVTRGSSPSWLANGTEFVFDLDGLHAAVFSLPTMMFNIISDIDSSNAALETVAVNATGDVAAIKKGDAQGNDMVALYGLPSRTLLGRFALPDGTTRIGFSPFASELALSIETSPSSSHLAALDWRTGAARKVGAMPGADVRGLVRVNGGPGLFLSRRISSDVWLQDSAGGRRRVTSDGENWSADLAPTGHLAVGKRTGDGKMIVVGYDPAGRTLLTSEGPNDRAPSFSADGKSLVYVRCPSSELVRCEGPAATCRSIHVDKALPLFPRFSPDGRHIAYVTQISTPRVRVIPADGGAERDLGPARSGCPPVWTGSDRLWIYQGTERDRRWSEFDVSQGTPTGRHKDALPAPALDQCTRDSEGWHSPFFGRARIEANEVSSLRTLDALAL